MQTLGQTIHKRRVPSFFLTNNTGAPHGDTLRRMKPFSSSSCNCTFNFFNSAGAILYGFMEIGSTPGITLISNYTSLSGGNPGNSSGNAFGKSYTVGMSLNARLPTWVSTTCDKYASHPLLIISG